MFTKIPAALLVRLWGKRKPWLLGFQEVNSMPQLHTTAKPVIIKPKMALQYKVISGLDMRKELQLCRFSVDSQQVKGKKLVLSCAPV